MDYKNYHPHEMVFIKAEDAPFNIIIDDRFPGYVGLPSDVFVLMKENPQSIPFRSEHLPVFSKEISSKSKESSWEFFSKITKLAPCNPSFSENTNTEVKDDKRKENECVFNVNSLFYNAVTSAHKNVDSSLIVKEKDVPVIHVKPEKKYNLELSNEYARAIVEKSLLHKTSSSKSNTGECSPVSSENKKIVSTEEKKKEASVETDKSEKKIETSKAKSDVYVVKPDARKFTFDTVEIDKTKPADSVTSKSTDNIQKMTSGNTLCKYGRFEDGFKVYDFSDLNNISTSIVTVDLITIEECIYFVSPNSKYVRHADAWTGLSGQKNVDSFTKFKYSIKQILNKMSLDGFYRQIHEFKCLKFEKTEFVSLYSTLIYDKAISDHAWTYLYAKFITESVKILEENYPEKGYGELCRNNILGFIYKGLRRDHDEEFLINRMKMTKIKNEEDLDKHTSEIAERETKYRDETMGVNKFIGFLYYYEFLSFEVNIMKYLSTREQFEDSYGAELYCHLLSSMSIKLIETPQGKSWLCSRIDSLAELLVNKKMKLEKTAEYKIKDLVYDKTVDFKNVKLPSVPVNNLAEISKESINAGFRKNFDLGDVNKNNYGRDNRDNSKYGQFRNNRFNEPNKRSSHHFRGSGFRRGSTGKNSFRDVFDHSEVNLDKENPTEHTRSNFNKRGNKDKGGFFRTQIGGNNAITAEHAKEIVVENNDTKPKEKLFDEKELLDEAETLVENLSLKNSNISVFLSQLENSVLKNHTDVLVKSAFEFSSNKMGWNFALGNLLVRLISKYPDSLEHVKKQVSAKLETLPDDAVDEPFLWDLFFLNITPLIESNSITFQEYHDMLCSNDEIPDANNIHLKMFSFLKDKLPKYYVAKIINQISESAAMAEFLAKNENSDFVKEYKSQASILLLHEGHYKDWTDMFLNSTFEWERIEESFNKFYTSSDEALVDITKTIYFNFNKEREAYDHITISRPKEKVDSLLQDSFYERLLNSLSNIIYRYDYAYMDVYPEVARAALNAGYITVDWLKERESEARDNSNKIAGEIYKMLG